MNIYRYLSRELATKSGQFCRKSPKRKEIDLGVFIDTYSAEDSTRTLKKHFRSKVLVEVQRTNCPSGKKIMRVCYESDQFYRKSIKRKKKFI